MHITRLGLAGLLAGSAMGASAATLDFTEIGVVGLVPETVFSLSNATITTFGDDTFVGAPFQFNETNGLGIICASPTGKNNCEEDMEIAFDTAVVDLSFSSFGAARGDFVEVTAFLDGADLGSVEVTSNTTIDLSAFGEIDTLFFSDSSTRAGIGFGDFDFAIAAIPLPAGMSLMLLGLGGLAVARKRA